MGEYRFKVGDIIVSKGLPNVKRRILELEKYGEQISYLWEYPDLLSSERNKFSSINSYDPELLDWEKVNG